MTIRTIAALGLILLGCLLYTSAGESVGQGPAGDTGRTDRCSLYQPPGPPGQSRERRRQFGAECAYLAGPYRGSVRFERKAVLYRGQGGHHLQRCLLYTSRCV